MSEQTVNKKRTLIRFAVQNTGYIAGKGTTTEWETIRVKIGTDSESGKPITTDCFYCEWLNSYGAAAIQQQADGVIRPARVRMQYVKEIYDALTTKDVRIYLNGDTVRPFRLASAADDYLQQHKMIEFQVKLYEVR